MLKILTFLHIKNGWKVNPFNHGKTGIKNTEKLIFHSLYRTTCKLQFVALFVQRMSFRVERSGIEKSVLLQWGLRISPLAFGIGECMIAPGNHWYF